MRLADKRKVIEVLLCGTDWCGPLMEDGFHDKELVQAAYVKAGTVIKTRAYSELEFDCCEAAYRLIESSPTLRREWFGAP